MEAPYLAGGYRRRRRGVAAWLLAVLATAAPWAQAEVVVDVVADDFVLPSRTARLDAIARPEQVRFRHVAVGPGHALPEGWPGDAALVVLDTPRPADREAVEKSVGERLAAARTPWIRVGGGAPAWGHLAEADARRLVGYYGNGGMANYRQLARWLSLRGHGGDTATLPPPQPQPATGYYLPGHAGWLGDAEALRAAWRDAGEDGWPRAAVIVAAGSVGALQTEVLDAVIAAARRRHVAAFGVWFDQGEDAGLLHALQGLDVDAVVNLTHLQNGRARSAELPTLDVPALQTLGWRQGDADAWRAASSGVPAPLLAAFVAVPEGWGLIDPMVVSATAADAEQPIPEQIDALAAKLARLAALRHTPAADKRLALLFWNAPDGEKNLSASGLNVPASLETLTRRLAAAGYDATPVQAKAFTTDAQAMLGGYYHPQTLDALLARGLAVTLPLARYRQWLDTLPPTQRQALLARWGDPAQAPGVRSVDGVPAFVLPALRLGKLLVMPQPPRAARLGEATHDMASLPSHGYLAAYLYLREGWHTDALVHFGTHGTQEWTPGKDRGLWVNDYPYLAVGDLPVFYPYIQDNVGEAVQARRRGRAVTISHQTPALAPSGLYDELRDLHAAIHEYLQLDAGQVRQATAARIAAMAVASGMVADLGWTRARIDADFDGFMAVLHDHLHELARTATPLGLHTFGEPAAPAHQLSTVMQQLGEPYYRALGQDPQEVFAGDYRQLQAGVPYRTLARYLRDGAPLDEVADPALRAMIEHARAQDAALSDTQEIEALLHGLAGGFTLPGAGGDPIRNPDVRSGRNLYLFEPDKLPTRAAFATGRVALDQLLDAYRADHGGALPDKLAFSLWSSEAIRHLGVLESEVLHALGLRPVWDAGGRVTALEIVPDAELAHPRIDAVVQVTSVYRDQFEPFMRLLAGAIDRLAALPPGPANPVAGHARQTEQALIARGIAPERARTLAALRIFGNAPGEYGSGFNHAVLERRDGAAKDDASLAAGFLARMQYAYGAHEGGIQGGNGVNLLAEQLHGVQAAVLARSSNVHGLLSTDHPFEYLGGLGLAVRHLDGASPPLYVADLRQATPKTTTAARFLADELRTRALNPQWISAMQGEGYAGTLEVLRTVDNLFGWQVADPASVRADQWQALHDTYVRDARHLGMAQWFGQGNPAAQAQLIERMREAIARGYWQPDARTRQELDARLRQLQAQAAAAASSVAPGTRASGFGRSAAPAPPAPSSAVPAATPAPPAAAMPAAPATIPVRGQVMRRREPAPPPSSRPAWLGLSVLLACLAFGAWRQRRARLPSPSPVR
jgi:cobaltochelatase CobN